MHVVFYDTELSEVVDENTFPLGCVLADVSAGVRPCRVSGQQQFPVWPEGPRGPSAFSGVSGHLLSKYLSVRVNFLLVFPAECLTTGQMPLYPPVLFWKI